MSKVSNLESKWRSQTTNPTNPVAGDAYFNTLDNTYVRFDGLKWAGIKFNTTTSTSTSSSTSTSTSTSTSRTTSSTSTSSSSSTSTTTSTTTTI